MSAQEMPYQYSQDNFIGKIPHNPSYKKVKIPYEKIKPLNNESFEEYIKVKKIDEINKPIFTR